MVFIKGNIYKISCVEPTEMMEYFRRDRVLNDSIYKEWINTIFSYNEKYVRIRRICETDPIIPWVSIHGCDKIIPFDCFEEYQIEHGIQIEDSDIENSDIDFF